MFPDLHELVTQAICDYYDICPECINRGWCFKWAYLASRVLEPGSWTFAATDGAAHSFLKIGDLYYDSDCPGGEQHWEKLPTFITFPQCAKEYREETEEGFLDFWPFKLQELDALKSIAVHIETQLSQGKTGTDG